MLGLTNSTQIIMKEFDGKTWWKKQNAVIESTSLLPRLRLKWMSISIANSDRANWAALLFHQDLRKTISFLRLDFRSPFFSILVVRLQLIFSHYLQCKVWGDSPWTMNCTIIVNNSAAIQYAISLLNSGMYSCNIYSLYFCHQARIRNSIIYFNML